MIKTVILQGHCWLANFFPFWLRNIPHSNLFLPPKFILTTFRHSKAILTPFQPPKSILTILRPILTSKIYSDLFWTLTSIPTHSGLQNPFWTFTIIPTHSELTNPFWHNANLSTPFCILSSSFIKSCRLQDFHESCSQCVFTFDVLLLMAGGLFWLREGLWFWGVNLFSHYNTMTETDVSVYIISGCS